MMTYIELSKQEIASNLSRVRKAELLIEQLPNTHDGRNTWLMNYGVRTEAERIRKNYAEKLKESGYVPRTLVWNDETECLDSVS